MTALSFLQRACRAASIAACALLGGMMTRCVSQYDILAGQAGSQGLGGAGTGGATLGGSGGGTTGGVPNSGGATSAGGPGGGGPPWTSCSSALAWGVDRDPCIGEFNCESAVRNCCKSTATCSVGSLRIAHVCEPCASCSSDLDCGPMAWCVNQRCRPCHRPPPGSRCELALFFRNGCPWCVTASNCRSDADCGFGKVCYPGQPCAPGCPSSDPACCHGSICGDPGCPPTAGLDCSLVGCPDGSWCDLVTAGQTCQCSPAGQWLCTQGSGNTCRPDR